jgi:hypothetical protein
LGEPPFLVLDERRPKVATRVATYPSHGVAESAAETVK